MALGWGFPKCCREFYTPYVRGVMWACSTCNSNGHWLAGGERRLLHKLKEGLDESTTYSTPMHVCIELEFHGRIYLAIWTTAIFKYLQIDTCWAARKGPSRWLSEYFTAWKSVLDGQRIVITIKRTSTRVFAEISVKSVWGSLLYQGHITFWRTVHSRIQKNHVQYWEINLSSCVPMILGEGAKTQN